MFIFQRFSINKHAFSKNPTTREVLLLSRSAHWSYLLLHRAERLVDLVCCSCSSQLNHRLELSESRIHRKVIINSSGNGIWALIWCVLNVVAYALVVFAMRKSNKVFIIPALIISIFDIIVGIIQGIIALAYLWIFS